MNEKEEVEEKEMEGNVKQGNGNEMNEEEVNEFLIEELSEEQRPAEDSSSFSSAAYYSKYDEAGEEMLPIIIRRGRETRARKEGEEERGGQTSASFDTTSSTIFNNGMEIKSSRDEIDGNYDDQTTVPLGPGRSSTSSSCCCYSDQDYHCSSHDLTCHCINLTAGATNPATHGLILNERNNQEQLELNKKSECGKHVSCDNHLNRDLNPDQNLNAKDEEKDDPKDILVPVITKCLTTILTDGTKAVPSHGSSEEVNNRNHEGPSNSNPVVFGMAVKDDILNPVANDVRDGDQKKNAIDDLNDLVQQLKLFNHDHNGSGNDIVTLESNQLFMEGEEEGKATVKRLKKKTHSPPPPKQRLPLSLPAIDKLNTNYTPDDPNCDGVLNEVLLPANGNQEENGIQDEESKSKLSIEVDAKANDGEVDNELKSTIQIKPQIKPKPKKLSFLEILDLRREAIERQEREEKKGKEDDFEREMSDSEVSMDESSLESRIELTEEKVLEIIESSYPTAIAIHEIADRTKSSVEEVHFHLQSLMEKKIVKEMSANTFTRVTENDNAIKVVKQMPKIVTQLEPTIAIITAQYVEKLAVDAMIDNKDTYVRYKMEGESNVYTLGNIGPHRVVSTKLPAIGSASNQAVIASGNSTTRLLGTFQRVDYVFIVGVAGGVPHYTDYHKHVRLGDVVVSTPVSAQSSDQWSRNKSYIYVHCEKNEKTSSPIHVQQSITPKNSPKNMANGSNGHHANGHGSGNGHANGKSNGQVSLDTLFTYKSWCPPNLELQEIARDVHDSCGHHGNDHRPWERFLSNGLDQMSNLSYEGDVFVRPSEETDKLYMSIGSKDVIEVGHPCPPQANGHTKNRYDPRSAGQPVIHFGAIGSGRLAVRDESIRQDIASKFGIKAFDAEFDSVTESIYGNRKDKYMFIRGISDYKDGSSKKSRENNWQPYAALSAAAFMKSVIMSIPVPIEEGTMV